MPIYATGAPKLETETPTYGRMAPDRKNNRSEENVATARTDDINQSVDTPAKARTATDDLSLVREGTQGQDDLGYTR